MNIFEEQFDTTSLEQGVWFQPVYPTGPNEGDPMVDKENGQPVRIRVRSIDSLPYRDYQTKKSRRNISHLVGAKSRRSDKDLVNENSKDDRAERVAALISGFDNIDQPGQQTTPSRDEILKFFADFDKDKGWVVRVGIVWLVDDIIKFAEDLNNFGAGAGNA